MIYASVARGTISKIQLRGVCASASLSSTQNQSRVKCFQVSGSRALRRHRPIIRRPIEAVAMATTPMLTSKDAFVYDKVRKPDHIWMLLEDSLVQMWAEAFNLI